MTEPALRSNFSQRQSRRQFLRQTALGGATVALAWKNVLDIHAADGSNSKPGVSLVGSNIYGWGQYAQRDHRPLQVEDVISALRDCGYDYLESNLDVERPDANGRFADQLRAKGLTPVSLYTGARLHDRATADEAVTKILAAARVARQSGFVVLSCNAEPIGREKTDAELQTQAGALAQLGQGLAAIGMHLAVHQHLPEMANHGREFHYDFDHTRPELVGWCYDVHWVWKGGVAPLAALEQYGERVRTWHLRQSRNGIWWEDLDDGDVDYVAVARYAKRHQLARRFSVELAIEPGTRITRSVVENHRRSREFVRRVFEA